MLLTSYGLVLLAPVAFQSLRLAAGGVAQPGLELGGAGMPHWVPVALAIGLSLSGGAAMVTVLKRLVSELEFHPYAGVAAAFGVLMGSALIALRAPFQLGSLNSGVCAVLCLLVSVTGGALSLRPGFAAGAMGGVIALAPAPLLALQFWATSEQTGSFQSLLSAMHHADRTFMGLTALFGLLLWLVALSSRAVASRRLEHELAIPLTRRKQPVMDTGSELALAPTVLNQPQLAAALAMPAPVGPNDPTERFSVWSFHDAPPRPEDFEFPELRLRRSSLWWALAVVFACISGLAAYLWVLSR
ncbi:MAG: hypothetical protein QM778_06235 [Myxococcales bacterium]